MLNITLISALHRQALNLKSGDDHWEKSLAAAAEARRQAQLVEAASQDTHTKMLAAQDATRNFEKARREHMAIQVRVACSLILCPGSLFSFMLRDKLRITSLVSFATLSNSVQYIVL